MTTSVRRVSAIVMALILAGCGSPTTTPAPSPVATPSAARSPTVAPTSPPPASTAEPATTYWVDATEAAIGRTSEWSNKVELADLDGDGDVDVLFANGGNYEEPGPPEATRIFINDGSARFEDRSLEILSDPSNLARVVKVRDVNGDGFNDIVIGNTYQTQSRLFLGRGGLAFEEVTETHLPAEPLSVGDLELGDVDLDGDLDMVLADWGPGNPMQPPGAPVRLWLNDGSGRFTPAAADAVPDRALGFSWDIEFIDVDNDTDLDILGSCKVCQGGALFHNDGSGVFSDVSDRLPQAPNNYEYEPMDVDGDGFLDVVTINDGPNGLETLLIADGSGGFRDATSARWPEGANQPADDNVIVFLDVESDGDADFLIGSLSGADRLIVNDGTGNLSMDEDVFSEPSTPGTLGMALADLDGDGRPDVVQAQGEVALADTVHLGALVPTDTAAPRIGPVVRNDGTVYVRVTDLNSGMTGLREVVVEVAGGSVPMTWYGEMLWRADDPGGEDVVVCATDAIGNQTCTGDVPAGT